MSIARQSFTDYELLFIDDGSGDGTTQILDDLIRSIPDFEHRARVLTLEKNEGVCFARNYGIDAAQGDYIAFLDFDDLWQPRYLELMHEAITQFPQSRVYLARTDFLRQFNQKTRVRSTGSLGALNQLDDTQFNAWHLLNNFPVGMGSAIVVERQLYRDMPDLKFDLALSRKTAEDVLLGFQLLARGMRPRYVDEPLCVHRKVMGSRSRGTAAFLSMDEREVNDYIAEHATKALIASVVRKDPAWERPLQDMRDRLNRKFDLKRQFRDPARAFGIRTCLAHPGEFKTLVRLHLMYAVIGSRLEPLLQLFFFWREASDAQALARVTALLRTVSASA